MGTGPVVCRLCGSHFPEGAPPAACPICADVRGLGRVPKRAPFTTYEELRATHHCVVREEAPDLTGIGVEPQISAGQRALLVRTPEGNVLWDCLPVLDDAAREALRSHGGLAAIAPSHPHFYGAMAEWSRAFDGVPVYVHAADRAWVTHPDPAIVFWEGERQPLPGGLSLVHCAGHFDGACMLHWPAGADGRGALLTGDPIAVTPDRHVSFMYAFPNLLPLSAAAVRRVVASVEDLAFDRIHGGWWGQRVDRDAKQVLRRSAERYIACL